jgi:peptide/nickel transport system permease protein
LLFIDTITFLLTRLLPGGPILALFGDKASDAAVMRLTALYGFDQPLWIQFARFVDATARGNLGESIAFRVPVSRLIADRLPVTLMLAVFATTLALVIAMPLASVAAVNRNRWPDLLIRSVFQVGLSTPTFYVGLTLLTTLAAGLRVFPVGGYGETALDHLYHLFLPALTLALPFSAVVVRNLRAAIVRILDSDFIAFALTKGLSNRVIFGHHVMPNALVATITIIGLHVGELLGGAVITETVFAVPGVGRLMVDSIFARDYPVTQGLVLVLAVTVSITVLLTDLLQMALDPRISQ